MASGDREERIERRWSSPRPALPGVLVAVAALLGAPTTSAGQEQGAEGHEEEQGQQAQEDEQAQQQGPGYPCRVGDVHRQFDFWIGEWDVYADGRKAGTNRVERILEGCVLLENWTNVRGRQGKSFNWVDRSTYPEPRWRQLWVADHGTTLDYYDGHYEDGAMGFRGHTYSSDGDKVLQKLTFIEVHADTVRQVFEQSTDDGESWEKTWEGLYVRKK